MMRMDIIIQALSVYTAIGKFWSKSYHLSKHLFSVEQHPFGTSTIQYDMIADGISRSMVPSWETSVEMQSVSECSTSDSRNVGVDMKCMCKKWRVIL